MCRANVVPRRVLGVPSLIVCGLVLVNGLIVINSRIVASRTSALGGDGGNSLES
jgi:hypothetical protein